MEFIIKQENYNEIMAKQIIKQVMKGLLMMKQKNLVFTDLKPHNIFVYYENEKLHVQINDYFLEQTF